MVCYCAAKTMAEALEVLGRGPVSIVSGGTDYFPAQNRNHAQEDILDVTRIAEISGVTQTPDGWRIGAATTFRALIEMPLPHGFDGLKQAARQIGSRQIQNVATVAGNLCNASPAADSVPVLLAMGAQVEIASQQGRRIVPLAKFILGARKTALDQGEMVSAIVIPALLEGTRSCFAKLGSREFLVISIAMVAVVIRVEQGHIVAAKIAVGACSAVAQRLVDLENALIGRRLQDLEGDFVTLGHVSDLAPLDDLRASAEYRNAAVVILCQRAIKGALGDD